MKQLNNAIWTTINTNFCLLSFWKNFCPKINKSMFCFRNVEKLFYHLVFHQWMVYYFVVLLVYMLFIFKVCSFLKLNRIERKSNNFFSFKIGSSIWSRFSSNSQWIPIVIWLRNFEYLFVSNSYDFLIKWWDFFIESVYLWSIFVLNVQL
jgi:hypothetical protein